MNTPVPRRTLEVAAATAARATHGSSSGVSGLIGAWPESE